MYQPVIEYSYLAEIKLVNAPLAGQTVPFLDIPQLRLAMKSVKTVGLSVFTATQLAVSPNSNTMVSTVAGMVLTLQVEGSAQDIYNIPCVDLLSASNSGLIRLFKEKTINFPKSFITILSATSLNLNESVCFNIIYRK